MNQHHAAYHLVPYPKIRRLEALAYQSTHHKPMMHGLIEVDVTRTRTFLRAYKARTGEALSFTAFLIACLGKAVDEFKAMQALRKGSRRLILFDDVDVYLPVEREVAGRSQIIPTIIRAANRKTVLEMHQEIRAVQVQDVTQPLKGVKALHWPWLQLLPVFRVVIWLGNRSPQLWKKYRGTIGLTTVGMFGIGAGWGIPLPSHSLWVTVGGIGEKPGVADGQIAIREYLSLTISFDHEIIDGAPAARFTERLKDLIESGYGLPDSMSPSELVVIESSGTESEALL